MFFSLLIDQPSYVWIRSRESREFWWRHARKW